MERIGNSSPKHLSYPRFAINSIEEKNNVVFVHVKSSVSVYLPWHIADSAHPDRFWRKMIIMI